MTVRRHAGDAAGDAGGDLAAQSPVSGASASGAPLRGSSAPGAPERGLSASFSVESEAVAVCSPEKPFGSRFWALLSDDEDDVESEVEEEGASGDEGRSVRVGDRLVSYLCRTPSPARDADLIEDSVELNQRQLKRLRRRDGQRLANRAALFFSSGEGMVSSFSSLGKVARSVGHIKLPVLEPSVFVDETKEGWTLVHRRRWSPAAVSTVRDPGLTGFSNVVTVGQTRLRAGAQDFGRRFGPSRIRQARQSRDELEGDHGPRIAKVGDASAGFAFRSLFGLTWKKCTTAAPVIRRRTSEVAMSGDGGRGGFNPGRGGFNPGRGGFGGGRGSYGGRGDFGGGRGDFGGGRGDHGFSGGRGDYGAGRAGYGAGRGGFGNNRAEYVQRGRCGQGFGRSNGGYGGGRGYQSNGFGAGGGNRQYVQGESSGAAGSSFGGNRDNQRYGGNQNRWSSGRGGAMSNRNRGQDAEGALRGGIDAALLQQTVEAVVAAVTPATKPKDVVADHLSVTVQSSDPTAVATEDVQVPVAEPTSSVPQQMGTTQGVPEGSGMAALDKEKESQGASKKKKEDKAGCFRCKKPGHYIDDCPTPFCDICESIHHVTSACHLLNAPKPTAILHGYANEGLMFFELACGVFKAKAENPKLAKVTVEGSTLTIPEIIEQLKKIVPSEKFNWEVFHFKDNIYRVKLPSKLEVQRLKNFGTYICTDKEACLAFDSWSSVEEPLCMLPEVWVRVSGLPSDVRSDYLTLWGVGTLFGKTLDVDMAYTRKNKVLRTKIGCLDHRLIPADSDMFIRRGFYKLHFEVEVEDESHEVDMVEANNGSDGNNGDNQGEEKNGGTHDMDMDNRDKDKEEAPKGSDHVGSNSHKGGEGMQEQCDFLEAIQFGTIDTNCAPQGNQYDAKKLNSLDPVFSPKSHTFFHAQNDKACTGSHVDLLSSGEEQGSRGVGIGARVQQPAVGQGLTGAASGVLAACAMPPAGRQIPPVSAVDASPGALSHVAARAADRMHVPASGHAVAGFGSSAPRRVASPVAATSPGTQKIPSMEAGQSVLSASGEANLGPMIGSTPPGSAVPTNVVAPGEFTHENFDNNFDDFNFGVSQPFDLDLALDSEHAMNICDNAGVGSDGPLGGMKGSMGVASSPVPSGKSFLSTGAFSFKEKSNVSLTLIETPVDNLAVRPTMEEVIAFGGIPQPSLGVRSSIRIGGQPGGDMLQMEKAMRIAQSKDASSCVGKSLSPKFSITNMSDDEIMHKAERLGISLGKSEGEVVKSIKGIKLLEEDRILTILQKNIDEYINKEDDPTTLVMSKVSTLCNDLAEDDCIPLVLDDHLEHLDPVIKEKMTRVRKIYDTTNIRKSTRTRIKRQFS